jgi:hypothetical protein
MMLQWIKRYLTRAESPGTAAQRWYWNYRSPQHFDGDLGDAVSVALREALPTDGQVLDSESPQALALLVATDSREVVRCLAAIKTD